ncbi:MAG: M1 family metallopeptidase [Myxococcota bacterium]|nr:M1 family metallopeptidase [Myxococcota bacterium]
MNRGIRSALLVLVIACGSRSALAPTTTPVPTTPAVVVQAPPAAEPTPPEMRLPKTARPIRNTVELTLDPATEVFSGSIAIDLEVTGPLDVLWLNGTDIEVDDAKLGDIATKPVYAKNFVGFVPAKPVAAGKHTLRVKYRGKMPKNDGDGIYTAQEAGDWYAFTQFEATDARKAFPCFDEPGHKVPWQLTLTVPKANVALSNTPVTSEKVEGAMKVVQFAETPPMPSYLVAFAVGPFEFVDAGKSRNGTPMRIVVPRGRTADAAYPAKVTGEILALLEDYFGTPYPYKKLDSIAVSVFNAGAMENPGLITYRQSIILTKPDEMTLGKQQTYASIAAHEIAHQWFGNLVTLAWWDDIWLNEAFATWAEAKVIDKWKPEWDGQVEMVASKSSVMGSDSLDSARTIRQPIEAHGDIQTGFDGITYAKGQAVLTMLERWIGPEVFQKGVRQYLAKHAWSTATYFDFVDAMTVAAGKDMRPVFDSFVLQSGVPKLSFTLACTAGAAPKLELAQERYRPTGSKIDAKRVWQVPVCVRWGAGKATGRDCTMLGKETGELALTAPKCPDWVVPNEAGLAYYRMHPKGTLLDPLLARADKILTLPERVGLISDLNALVSAGDLKNSVALALVDKLAKDKSRHIVDASIGVVASIDEMVPDNLRKNYERLIIRLYRARAVELGWRSKKGESDDIKQMRPALLSLVAGTGRDPALSKEATALAWKWLDDHSAVEPEVTGAVLGVAASRGDEKLFERVYADAKKEKDRTERTRLLGMLGSFTDPKLVARAMGIAITDEFELREGLGLLQGGFRERGTREAAYKFFIDNFDKIAAKLPEMYRPYMAYTFVSMCDDSRKAEFEKFFRPRIEKLDGGEHAMNQALEALTLCSAQRKAQAPGVIAFLKKQ